MPRPFPVLRTKALNESVAFVQYSANPSLCITASVELRNVMYLRKAVQPVNVIFCSRKRSTWFVWQAYLCFLLYFCVVFTVLHNESSTSIILSKQEPLLR